MHVLWRREAWEDYLGWQSSDAKVLAKINDLIADIRRHPFTGLGKPEPLRGQLAGWWSRRITAEHRLVYRVIEAGEAQRLEIVMARYHY